MRKIAGVVWYENEIVYRRAVALFDDALDMPPTYEDWLFRVKQTVEQLEHAGWTLIRAELDPETFPGWCKARGLNVDAQARTAFGDAAAAEWLRGERGRGKI